MRFEQFAQLPRMMYNNIINSVSAHLAEIPKHKTTQSTFWVVFVLYTLFGGVGTSIYAKQQSKCFLAFRSN